VGDVEVVVEEVEETRRTSVSTVELDDTETHIVPSGSFLGSYHFILLPTPFCAVHVPSDMFFLRF
jgi:hypothetical protein